MQAIGRKFGENGAKSLDRQVGSDKDTKELGEEVRLDALGVGQLDRRGGSDGGVEAEGILTSVARQDVWVPMLYLEGDIEQ